MRGSRFRPQSRARALRAYHAAADASRGNPARKRNRKSGKNKQTQQLRASKRTWCRVTPKSYRRMN